MSDGMPNAVETQVQTCISRGEYRGALELLARTYLDTVYRYCLRMLHEDTGRARDVTQQVFEEVCKGITSYRGESSVKTWLLAITRNQCLKEIDTHVRRSAMLRDNVMQVESQAHTLPHAEQRRLSSQEVAAVCKRSGSLSTGRPFSPGDAFWHWGKLRAFHRGDCTNPGDIPGWCLSQSARGVGVSQEDHAR